MDQMYTCVEVCFYGILTLNFQFNAVSKNLARCHRSVICTFTIPHIFNYIIVFMLTRVNIVLFTLTLLLDNDNR